LQSRHVPVNSPHLKTLHKEKIMAKEDLDGFFDAMRNDVSLAEKFAQAVGDFARNEGFSVDDQDVYDHFTSEEPSTRPLPDDGGRMSTMAMGEEGGRMTTMAMGEEGGGRIKPMPPASVTLAIGEEDKRGPRPPRRTGDVTSAAIGEEDKRRDPPAHPITTMAVGEETKKPRVPKP
jgi:hypothetical protein